MFLSFLRSMHDLCDHSDDSLSVVDRVLTCRECDFTLPLEYYFLQMVAEEYSLTAAEKYVQWSGDRSIPCKISLVYLDRLLTVRDMTTTFETVATATRLLRILHEPLKKGTPQPTAEDLAFFRETVSTELRAAIYRVSGVSPDIDSVLRAILSMLLKHFESVRYFDVVVPHLKRVHRRDPYYQLFKDDDYEENVSVAYRNRIAKASGIHKHLSLTCAAFDAVHVAVLCYLCRDDPRVVYDLVLDFAGRFCRGYHHDDAFPVRDSSVLAYTRSMLDENVSLKSNPKIYLYLEKLREGDLADCFSDEFFRTHWQLKSVLFAKEDSDFDYLYPRSFFSDYVEYYAFWAALSHYAAEMDVASKNINELLVVGIVSAPAGLISQCKAIYRFVRKALSKMKHFYRCFVQAKLQEKYKRMLCDDAVLFEEEREIEPSYTWSTELLRSFFKSDPEFAKEVVEATEWLPFLPLEAKNDPDLIPVLLNELYKIGKKFPK